MAEKDVKKIKIVARAMNPAGPGGRRCRAGLFFGPEPKNYEVTEKQLAEIRKDPHLAVDSLKEEGTSSGKATSTSLDMTVEKAVDVIARMKTIEELDAFIEGDDRKGVNKAADDIRESLEG